MVDCVDVPPVGQPLATNDRHLQVVVDVARRLVRVSRTAQPLTSAEDVATMVRHAQRCLRPIERSQYSVLIDMRRALLADEHRYSEASVALRRELVGGFRRTAFLVETQMGVLQVQRFAREEKLSTRVCLDEGDAIEYLTED